MLLHFRDERIWRINGCLMKERGLRWWWEGVRSRFLYPFAIGCSSAGCGSFVTGPSYGLEGGLSGDGGGE